MTVIFLPDPIHVSLTELDRRFRYTHAILMSNLACCEYQQQCTPRLTCLIALLLRLGRSHSSNRCNYPHCDKLFEALERDVWWTSGKHIIPVAWSCLKGIGNLEQDYQTSPHWETCNFSGFCRKAYQLMLSASACYRYYLAGRNYHGPAIAPSTLSIWESVTGVGKNYDPVADEEDRLRDLMEEQGHLEATPMDSKATLKGDITSKEVA